MYAEGTGDLAKLPKFLAYAGVGVQKCLDFTSIIISSNLMISKGRCSIIVMLKYHYVHMMRDHAMFVNIRRQGNRIFFFALSCLLHHYVNHTWNFLLMNFLNVMILNFLFTRFLYWRAYLYAFMQICWPSMAFHYLQPLIGLMWVYPFGNLLFQWNRQLMYFLKILSWHICLSC